jgi:hypothetical protein
MTGNISRIHNIFLLSPSLFSLIGGSLIGAATNLLTNLNDINKLNFYIIVISSALILLSSLFFIWLSLTLEDNRHKQPDDELFLYNIEDSLPRLTKILVCGILFLIIGVSVLIYHNLMINSLISNTTVKIV